MLTDETIQAVRERANVADIVGERIKLERKGRSLVGLCPFHKEKSPSFHVNDERGFYYCFGCHASGDAIKFVQETEGLSFIEAVRELANQLGIEIQETRGDADRRRDDAARRQREQLLSVSEAAAEFFEQALLKHPLRHHARAELERRGLSLDPEAPAMMQGALRAFRIGYAPHAWDALATFLRSKGADLKAAEAVGLLGARKQGSGYYDRFRHRLMFAVVDLRGRVVGFSGRALDEPDDTELERLGLTKLSTTSDGNVAKYMNSPESAIYRKRELVFGLHQARDAVRQLNECVLVEGNFDVMSLHARGVQNVVAPLGTAFTQEQAAQIRRYTANVTLLFDGDSAGRRASVSAREPAKAEGLSARVAQLPSGKDPDDFVHERGVDALRACLKSAKGMLEFLIETTLESDFRVADTETRGRKIKETLELIKAEEDPTVRAMAKAHADTIAARLGISDVQSLNALARAIQSAARGSQPEIRGVSPERARSRGRIAAIEEEALGALVEHPVLLDDPEVRELLRHASGSLAIAIAIVRRHGGELMNHIERFDESLRDLVSRRLAAPLLDDEAVAREILRQNLHRLARLDEKSSNAETVERLRQAAASGDLEAELELLNRAQEAGRERERRRSQR